MTQATFTQLLHHFGTGHVTGFFLVFARITPLFILAPLFSSKMLPPQARVVIAVGLSLGLTPIALHGIHVPSAPTTIAALMVENLLVGLAFSLAVSTVISAVEAAGSLADTTSGFSYAALIDPMDNSQGGIFQTLYSLVGLALFIAIGGDAWMLRGIAKTLQIVPLTHAPNIASMTAGVLSASGTIFIAALEVAAPVLLALFVTDIAFGMVSRVVPQLNIFSVGFPLKVGVALLVVTAALPFIGGFMSNQIASAVGTALQSF